MSSAATTPVDAEKPRASASTAASGAPTASPTTTTTTRQTPRRSSADTIDRIVVTSVLLLVLVMAAVIPLGYVSREAGVSVGETAYYFARRGMQWVNGTSVASHWPVQRALHATQHTLTLVFSSVSAHAHADAVAAKMHQRLQPGEDGGTRTSADGVPVDEFSGTSVLEVFAEDDALLDEYANDDSYTRYQDSAIFFRPLPRKVPVWHASGKPEARYVYQQTRGDARKVSQVKERMRRDWEAEREYWQKRRGRQEAYGRATSKASEKSMVSSYGMAEIDPETNRLRNISDRAAATRISPRHDYETMFTVEADGLQIPIPCVHPSADLDADSIQFSLYKAFVMEDTYVQHPGDPYDAPQFSWETLRHCLRRILPMMCVGDKWEIICPRNMTSAAEKVPRRSFAFRMDIRGLLGPSRSLAEARAALAEGVFLTSTDGVGPRHEAFTRAMLLERAMRRPPRIKL